MKRRRVKIAGRLKTVPRSIAKSRGKLKLWLKKKTMQATKPKMTFGKMIKKQMAQGIKDSAYEPERPKRRWNQR